MKKKLCGKKRKQDTLDMIKIKDGKILNIYKKCKYGVKAVKLNHCGCISVHDIMLRSSRCNQAVCFNMNSITSFTDFDTVVMTHEFCNRTRVTQKLRWRTRVQLIWLTLQLHLTGVSVIFLCFRAGDRRGCIMFSGCPYVCSILFIYSKCNISTTPFKIGTNVNFDSKMKWSDLHGHGSKVKVNVTWCILFLWT